MPRPRGVPLSQSHPALALELHPTKNDDWTAENLVAGTNRKLWWICKAVSESSCGHVWQAYGSNRSRKNQGCPACSNHAVHNDGRNSMRATNLELAEDFHPTKNGDLTPDNIIASTGKKLWWRCRECENEWENTGSHRAKRGQGCPACYGNALHSDGRNSMIRTNPDLSAEFHPSKNEPDSPSTVIAGTNRKLWWICNQCENEWLAQGNSRLRGAGCPACAGQSLHSDGRNSMRNTRPELAEEFHPTKNGDLTSDNIMAGTGRKLWWICKEVSDEPCGHVWKASGGERLKHGCPPCGYVKSSKSQRTPKPGKSLGNLFPEISAEWHEVKNGDKEPTDFNPGTDDIVWWKCDEAEDHVWEATISSRTGPRKGGCPYCRGLKASVTNSITSLIPEIVSEWDTSKNGEVGPSEVVAGSEKKYWWKCSKCEHGWKISPANRKFGSGCPACTNKALHIDGRNSLVMTHPELATEFHPSKNEPDSPSTVIAGTNRKLWWICNQCENEWLAQGNSRVRGAGCSACAGKSLHSDGRNSMMRTHPEIAEEFDSSKNAPITTEGIVAGTQKLYWWVCNTCSFGWRTSPANRSRHNTGCPECAQTGFNPNQLAYYYVNEVINTETQDRLYYKAGISNDWERRLYHLDLDLPENMEMRHIENIEFERGRDASELESRLKKVDEIRAPVRGFPGGTELFLENPLDYARENGWVNPSISNFETTD